MRRLQILRGQLQYKPELKDGEFFLDKTNHSLLIGDAAAADGQFELAKQSSITNLQQQVNTKITAEQAPVQSVNTKTGAVVLTAADVGALPDTTSIPTKTSEIDNDSGFITAAQAPVQSVDGATGAVTTNAVKYTEQTLTDDQKTQARTNIGAGTSSFSGSYDDLSNKPTIPSTAADVGAVPTTRTVNGKALSADITLSASDVGALPDTAVIPTVPVYSLTKDATSADYAAVYHLTKDNINVGEPINIPKDLFVESGEIVDNPTGYPEGKYIKLTLQNQTEPIYINVADLVDAYTAGNGITISNTNVVSANVSAGNGLSVDADGIKMGAASGTSAGAMSSADFTKLSGIEAGAQKNTVTSVNGATGAVTVTAPVTSVNTKTGAVALTASDVGALPDTTTIPAKTSELTNDSGYITQTDGDGRYLKISGGKLTGEVKVVNGEKITFYADETGEETYVSMYMDNNYDLVISGSATGGDTIGRLKMYNVMTPTNSYMAANKYYVDQYAPHATLVTLTVAGWNSTAKTQTVTVSGILADESKQLIIPMPAAAFMTAYNDAGIQCTGQAANSLTFTATTVPTAAISVYVTYQAVIS